MTVWAVVSPTWLCFPGKVVAANPLGYQPQDLLIWEDDPHPSPSCLRPESSRRVCKPPKRGLSSNASELLLPLEKVRIRQSGASSQPCWASAHGAPVPRKGLGTEHRRGGHAQASSTHGMPAPPTAPGSAASGRRCSATLPTCRTGTTGHLSGKLPRCQEGLALCWAGVPVSLPGQPAPRHVLLHNSAPETKRTVLKPFV